jgi:hypothetical protein
LVKEALMRARSRDTRVGTTAYRGTQRAVFAVARAATRRRVKPRKCKWLQRGGRQQARPSGAQMRLRVRRPVSHL